MKVLNQAQRKYLRSKAHHEKPIFQMGKYGLTEAFIEQVDSALNKRELIKFNVLQNSLEEVSEVAIQIADAVDGYVVQTLGNVATLYRPSSVSKNKKISLEVEKLG